jgi:hypothetical protein
MDGGVEEGAVRINHATKRPGIRCSRTFSLGDRQALSVFTSEVAAGRR